jgi:predicted nucleotidyltransferase
MPPYGSPASAMAGSFRYAQAFGLNIPTPHSIHSLSALEMLRISLSGLPNRRIQPERYVPFFSDKIRLILAAHKEIWYYIDMKRQIMEVVTKKLLEIEKEHDVKILYAVESGSRAWGFESPDSDFDVRFIYVHNKNWYLNILPKRDVIEYPIIDEYDYSGWDLRKAMFLMNKSNPVLFEWLKSPVVYYKNEYFYNIMEQLSKEYFSPISTVYHYLHMARGNYRQYLQADEIKIKKYFYVLRPIMACMWIEKYKESPPMEFEKLLEQISDKELSGRINELLLKKKSGIELGVEPKIARINDFMEEKMKYYENIVSAFDPKGKPKQEVLEEGFIKILEYAEKTPSLSMAKGQEKNDA